MRKLVFAAALLAASAPATAEVTQCYDRLGRPIGPATFGSGYPSYAFLLEVQRRGGHCARSADAPLMLRPQLGYPADRRPLGADAPRPLPAPTYWPPSYHGYGPSYRGYGPSYPGYVPP
jgi:hypothetical protein